MNLKRTAAVAATFALVSGLVAAQPAGGMGPGMMGGYGMGPGMMGGYAGNAYAGLDLSAEQRKKIDAVLTPEQREQLRRAWSR